VWDIIVDMEGIPNDLISLLVFPPRFHDKLAVAKNVDSEHGMHDSKKGDFRIPTYLNNLSADPRDEKSAWPTYFLLAAILPLPTLQVQSSP
jgi:hypothetical protein